MNPAFLTIAELERFFDRGEASPVEVTQALFDRIAEYDSSLNSFIRVTPEIALTEAKAAEAELMAGRKRGPMHGVPYALKDIIETAGSRRPATRNCASTTCPRPTPSWCAG